MILFIGTFAYLKNELINLMTNDINYWVHKNIVTKLFNLLMMIQA